jgi:hypothetical protein
MSPSALSETGPWKLPIEAFEVLQITFAFLVDITAYGDEGVAAKIRLEGPFTFATADSELKEVDATQPWENLGLLFCLRRDRIETAVASEQGDLDIRFLSGSRLTAGAGVRHASWEVWGPEFHLSSAPDRHVVVWN